MTRYSSSSSGRTLGTLLSPLVVKDATDSLAFKSESQAVPRFYVLHVISVLLLDVCLEFFLSSLEQQAYLSKPEEQVTVEAVGPTMLAATSVIWEAASAWKPWMSSSTSAAFRSTFCSRGDLMLTLFLR